MELYLEHLMCAFQIERGGGRELWIALSHFASEGVVLGKREEVKMLQGGAESGNSGGEDGNVEEEDRKSVV